MKHAGCVYAENTVIALITILLIGNFHSLLRMLPAPAFVENSFHPLLRNMLCMSSGSSGPRHTSQLKNKRCICVCVCMRRDVMFCSFLCSL